MANRVLRHTARQETSSKHPNKPQETELLITKRAQAQTDLHQEPRASLHKSKIICLLNNFSSE